MNDTLNKLQTLLDECKRLATQLGSRPQPPPPSMPTDYAALVGYLALNSDVSDDELLQMILRSAMYVVGAGGAGLTLLEPSRNTLVFRAAIGDGAMGIIGYEVPLEGSQHGLAFATGDVQASTPLNADIEAAANARFRNVLVAPLLVDDEPIGTLSAVNKLHGAHFTPADIEAYRHFADLAAIVVRQRLRQTELYQRLTGVALASTALPDVHFTPADQQVADIVHSVSVVARTQPDLLPLCQQLISLVAHRTLPGQ